MSAEQYPPFCHMIRASGLGEIWTHGRDDMKFGQFGWRCTTKENSYGTGSLVGNWSEARFDVEKMKQAKCLPSQYNHYFESTYDKSYNGNTSPVEVPQTLKHLKARHSHAHPAHQPELDTPSLKETYNSWSTSTRAAFCDPKIREQPIGANPQEMTPVHT